jgi:hypothetical protein
VRSFRSLTVFAVVVVAAAALIACNSGGNSTSTGGASPAATASGATTTAATQEATGAGSNAGSGGSSNELNALAKKFAAATFHATYKATSSGSDAFANGQMVLIKDGDKRLRFEATVSQDGQDMQVIFIATDTVSAFCLKDAGQFGALLGIEPGKGVCFKSDPNDQNNPVGSISSLFSDLENMDVTVLDKSSRQVAGKDATCYKTRDNKTSDVSTDCFTKDGVLMYSQSEGSSGFEMEATDVSGSVSGSDFDLPYEVRDLPASSGG